MLSFWYELHQSIISIWFKRSRNIIFWLQSCCACYMYVIVCGGHWPKGSSVVFAYFSIVFFCFCFFFILWLRRFTGIVITYTPTHNICPLKWFNINIVHCCWWLCCLVPFSLLLLFYYILRFQFIVPIHVWKRISVGSIHKYKLRSLPILFDSRRSASWLLLLMSCYYSCAFEVRSEFSWFGWRE